MKSIEFLSEAPVDDIIDQAGADTQAARLGNTGLKTATGFASGLKQGMQASTNNIQPKTNVPRLHQSTYGKTLVQPTGNQTIAYVPGKVDAHVADYLTKAANNQPLKQATGNQQIDVILKAAGLLK